MAYYTARYVKHGFTNNEKPVWEGLGCRVYAWQNRLELCRGEYALAQLIDGQKGLDRYHKGSFEHWVRSVWRKDVKKEAKLRSLAQKVLDDAAFLDAVWS